MQLFTLGLNHQTAPLAIRERVAFHAERLRSALAELTLREPVREAAILSTCNRTEIYCALGEPQAALEWLAGYHRVEPQELKPYLYTLPQGEAVRHAFRVASGLDSMVVGGRQAWRWRAARCSGPNRSHAASTRSRSSYATCPSVCRNTTSSFPALQARCRSSARVRWSARYALAATARYSWSTSPCPGTSKPRWRRWTTYFCIPSMISRRRCARASMRDNLRSRRPKRSLSPRSAPSCIG